MASVDAVEPLVSCDTQPELLADFDRPSGRWRIHKRVAFVAAAADVAAGASTGVYFATGGGSASGASTASTISVTTEKVTVSTGRLKETVASSGSLEPAEDSDLTFAVSGTVTAVDVTTGQKVTAGQTLATISSTALADDVAAAQATVTSAEDRLATDEDDAAATSQIDTDLAAITSAQSQLSTAKTDLADAALKATFSGTVAAVDLAVGDQVSGTAGSGGNSAAASGSGSSTANAASSGSSSDGITVISTDNYNVTTSVDDTEVGQVKVGDQADLTVSGSTTPIYGTVSSVSLIASASNSSVASFPVDIAVTGAPTGLYAGASVTVSIITKQLNDVVEVPTAAISYTSANPTVTEVVSGRDVTEAVITGISAGGETQITAGLKAGDVITQKVVKFNGGSGTGSRSLFGGTGTATGTGGTGGGFGGGPPRGVGGAG